MKTKVIVYVASCDCEHTLVIGETTVTLVIDDVVQSRSIDDIRKSGKFGLLKRLLDEEKHADAVLHKIVSLLFAGR